MPDDTRTELTDEERLDVLEMQLLENRVMLEELLARVRRLADERGDA